jgi:predicted nuclease of predicted toxin-antitoxin system
MLYADEHIPLKIVQRLRSEGYRVEDVPRGLADREIPANALAEHALILTDESDFSRMILDEGKLTAGVVIISISFRVPVEDEARIIVEM